MAKEFQDTDEVQLKFKKGKRSNKNSVLPEDLQVTRGISVPLFIIKIIRQQLCQIASSVATKILIYYS